MIIINIFIAIIIAIGFWRNTSKEHKRMVAKASFTKTAILFLLSLAMTFFYYKSYQVATFKNWVVVKGIKGSYSNNNDTIITNGDTIIKNNNDRIRLLTFLSKFTHNDLYYSEPYSQIWDSINYSGTRTYVQLYNNKGNTKWFPNITSDDIPNNYKEINHIYKVFYYTNTIPNFMPFAYYEDYSIEEYNKELNEGEYFDLDNFGFKISKNIDEIGNEYDKVFACQISSKKNNSNNDYTFFRFRTFSNYVNTLNFFSAADLSQCQYQIKISSDIKLDMLGMYFDLPIEISSLDVIKHHVSSKGFFVNLKDINNEGKNMFLDLHVKFPTLANLQLIRSLILTTLLTALLALFFKNLYYFGRKLYKRRKRKLYKKLKREQKKPFTYSRKMVLLWVPVGKFIVWSFIVVFAFLLFLSILNIHFRIDVTFKSKLKFIIAACIIVYVILVCWVSAFLYKRGYKISDLIYKLLYEPVESEKETDDVKPSPKAEEKVEETSKIEGSPSNEIANQEGAQKPSKQPPRPKKGKTRKRR